MASYGTRIVLPLPTAGAAQWDGPLGDLINAIVDVLATQVTPAGISITSALDMGGQALIDCADIAFSPGPDTGAVNTIFVAGSGQSGLTAGEWYLRDTSNRLIQLTSGGQVNVAGSAGFGGDYASATQAAGTPIAQYNASNGTYSFTTDGSTVAIVSAGTVDVSELVVTGLSQFSGSVRMTGSVAMSATGSVSLSGSMYVYAGPLTGSAVQQVKWDVTGRYLGRQTFLTNQTYTPSKGCTNIVIRMCGGGGGGGGAGTGTGGAVGGGGSSGVYIEVPITLTSTTGSVVLGGGGGGGASTGGDGANGGDSVFFINGTNYVAKGGLGGKGGTSASAGISNGGGINFGSSAGTIFLQEHGGAGWQGRSVTGLDLGVSGRGGSNPFGSGGGEIAASMTSSVSFAGNDGYGAGGGGGGAIMGNSGAGVAGGNGQNGQLVIDEYR